MATATLEKAEVQVARDVDVVAADLSIIQRHLRRKIRIEWEPPTEDGVYPGGFIVGKNAWQADLCYREKYDVYRFRFLVVEQHSNAIARRFDVSAKNAYTLCNDVIALHATLRLLVSLDLEQDWP